MTKTVSLLIQDEAVVYGQGLVYL